MAGPKIRPHNRLDRLRAQARAALLVERLWPFVVLLAAIVAGFVAVSWFGLWLAVPAWLRGLGLAGFAAALVWA
ncbi:hypothetical protein P7D22_17465, partial [Lichenihabitans sp. Uapishka_5]|uniref:DUF4175 family protein n=1 Tax=Lichenihabitans sp. Uapishka_5 TaxID=3037302 RepID=UPI0029E803F0